MVINNVFISMISYLSLGISPAQSCLVNYLTDKTDEHENNSKLIEHEVEETLKELEQDIVLNQAPEEPEDDKRPEKAG